MATPVLADLKAQLSDLDARLHRSGARLVEDRRARVLAAERALRRTPDLLRLAEQRFDLVAGRLAAGLARNLAIHERALAGIASRVTPLLLQRPIGVQRDRLAALAARLEPAARRRLERASDRLAALSRLHAAADPDRPLALGFARVSTPEGELVRAGARLAAGQPVDITFADRATRRAVIDGGPTPAARPKARLAPPAQGDLF